MDYNKFMNEILNNEYTIIKFENNYRIEIVVVDKNIISIKVLEQIGIISKIIERINNLILLKEIIELENLWIHEKQVNNKLLSITH